MGISEPERLKVWLLTDVFPPRSGGSGWSTYYLGRALQARGHHVRVMRPTYGAPNGEPALLTVEYGGLMVDQLAVPPAPGAFRRVGLGRAWEERQAVRLLARRASRLAIFGHADVLHGQHKVSALAASRAAAQARRVGAPVVSLATVRDYWPLCPVSTRLFAGASGPVLECRECHRLLPYLRCSAGDGKVASLPLSLARWASTGRDARAIARCDAVIAVSHFVRGELERSGRLPAGRLHAIPNMVDRASAEAALEGPWPLHDISPEDPFLLYVGKLDLNKGAQLLPDALTRSGVSLPVVLAGDGPLRAELEAAAAARGLDFRFADWLENDAVLRLMRAASVLLFPSAWQEPLSRVLLEACAVGAAIAALDTGGTSDIIEHMRNGWLAPDMDSFVAGVNALCGNADLNARLRQGARRVAEERFSSQRVSAEVEALYYDLIRAETAG